LVTDLAVQRSTGGKGKSRICAEAEKIIDEVIRKFYMSKQRFSEAVVVREISKRCKQASIAVPSRNTIRRRVDGISSLAIAAKRFGHEETRSLKPVLGSTPKPMKPLEFVQMDHTKVDLIIVEQQSREPIGRPFLTLAIDVFSRCIVGMLLTLEAPSATSVGLCLAHCVIDKKPWLETLGLPEVSWPVRGKPGTICSDNGPEFKSEALIRGCQQHGITLEYRPLGEPQYGGIIERVIPSVSMMFETSSGFSLV
jgi:putative transposase